MDIGQIIASLQDAQLTVNLIIDIMQEQARIHNNFRNGALDIWDAGLQLHIRIDRPLQRLTTIAERGIEVPARHIEMISHRTADLTTQANALLTEAILHLAN